MLNLKKLNKYNKYNELVNKYFYLNCAIVKESIEQFESRKDNH